MTKFLCTSEHDCTYKVKEKKAFSELSKGIKKINCRASIKEHRQFIEDITTLGFTSIQAWWRDIFEVTHTAAERKRNNG